MKKTDDGKIDITVLEYFMLSDSESYGFEVFFFVTIGTIYGSKSRSGQVAVFVGSLD